MHARRGPVAILALVTMSLAAQPAAASPGDLAWKATIASGPSSVSNAAAVAISGDGDTVFIAGTVGSATNGQDWVTAAYDAATGARRWLRRYDGPAHEMDQVVDVAVSPDDATVFVTGGTRRTASVTDITTIAYSAATGQPVWKGRHATGSSAYGLAITVLGRRVFVAGVGPEAIMIALSATTGAELWVKTGPDDPGSSFLAVAAANGTVVAGGSAIDASHHGDAWLTAFDAKTGARRWTRYYRGPGGGNDNVYDLAISSDGSTVYAAGDTERVAEDRVVTMAHLVSSGTRLWLRRTDPKPGGFDLAPSVAVAPDGTAVFIAVQSFESGAHPYYKTVAYTSGGAKLWASPVREDDVFGEGGSPTDIAVSPDGSTLFVTGAGSPGLSQEGSLTYAYDAAVGGDALWYAYREPNVAARAYELVVAPDGTRIYPAGTIGLDVRIEAFATV